MQYYVKFLPEDISIKVDEGESLLAAANKAGVYIESNCGGRGTCGKCAVKVIDGKVYMEDAGHLPADLAEEGYVLACRAKVCGDLTVEAPLSSRLTKHKVLLSNKKTKFSKENNYFSSTPMNPFCKKLYIALDQPSIEDSTADVERLKQAIKMQYGMDEPAIAHGVMKKLSQALRQGEWSITLTVGTFEGRTEILDIAPGYVKTPALGIAVDIGTTTVVAYLMNLESGKIIDKAGTYNEQAIYGSDVISRIVYAGENSGGLQMLQNAIANTINGLLDEIYTRSNVTPQEIPVMVCAGNTVMTHLFLGIPPDYLRLEPYIPAASIYPSVKAGELALKVNPDGYILSFPTVSSYVGGDIVAGVLSSMLSHSAKLTLFIDIGTNGELVLGNNEWLVTCSCSAGPAFEGSGVTDGMRAMDGAIDTIRIDRDTLGVAYTVVNNEKPLGICGSGLIQALSEMMESGIIDRAGKIKENRDCSRIRKTDDGIEFVVVWKEESGSEHDIVITENDIKNLLRAKGAIFAAIRIMLDLVQLDMQCIERIFIAGGFGRYINITDAINIGLLPDLPEDRFEYIGNSSVQGAMIGLLSMDAFEEAKALSKTMTYLELSIGNKFMEEFISALFIPHTDLSLFLSLSGRNV